MKKMLKLLVALLILYFILQRVFYFFSTGHTVEYSVKSNDKLVNIKEVLSVKKEATDGYYLELNFDDYTIPFKIYKKYGKQKRIVNNVELFYGNSYVCAKLGISKKTNETDIKCTNGNIVYYYSVLKGYDASLDEQIASSNYDATKYINDEFVSSKDNINYYPNNYINGKNILVSLYKGVYLFGKGVTNGARFVQLFEKDQYIKPIEGFVDGYYIVANYNEVHEFLNFYSINIATGDKDDIRGEEFIPFSSYIQGAAEGKLYIIDPDNKKQYAINPKKKSIELVGNANTGAQVYTKDGWVTKNMTDVIDSKEKFENGESVTYNNESYDKVKTIGNVNYLFKNTGNGYAVYITYKEDNKSIKNYVFTTTDINRISYVGGTVYYIYDDEIRVFTIDGGIKKLVEYNEIKYNTNLSFYVY